MPEVTNNSSLDILAPVMENEDNQTMIKVDNVSMVFNMASEKLTNLKEYFVSIIKHNLFFEELLALDDISFEVKKGDVFGIVGTNGSGKSTLLKIVAGVLDPTKGKVEINGGIAPLIELGAGFDMDLSARENIYLNGALLGYSKSFIEQHFDEIVKFAEIEKFLDMPMKNYSSGMVARIAFSIATVIVPEILIVDEVLSVGDFMFQKKCEDRIKDLIENHNTTVLIVSHSNDQIARLCNKAIWIEKGKTRMIGDAKEVCNIYSLIGGREGSEEAEKSIIDTYLKTKDMPEKNNIDIIGGSSFAEISLNVTKEAIKQSAISSLDTICFAAHDIHLNAACANSVGGLYDAPVISIGEKEVDNCILDWLENVKPPRIIIFNYSDNEACLELSKRKFKWKPKIIYLGKGNSALEWTYEVATHDEWKDKWENSLILADALDPLDTVPKSLELLYGKHSPIFIFNEQHYNNLELLEKYTNSATIKSVYKVGTTLPESIIKTILQNLSLDSISRFNSSNHENAVIINDDPTACASLGGFGFYSNCTDACLISINETKLDSINSALKTINQQNVNRITFVKTTRVLSTPIIELLNHIID